MPLYIKVCISLYCIFSVWYVYTKLTVKNNNFIIVIYKNFLICLTSILSELKDAKQVHLKLTPSTLYKHQVW